MTTRKKVSPTKTASKKGKAGKSAGAFSLPAGIKNVKISAAQLRDHVMRPQHILGVSCDNGLETEHGEFTVKAVRGGAVPRKGPTLKHLNVSAFGTALHNALKNDVVGYCMRLQQNGSTISTLQWNWAQTPSDAALNWNPTRVMHVASISKLITAIAITKLLNQKGISVDAKIIDFLPDYWVKGQNINKITFRNLLTHRAGFATPHSESDFESMKFNVMMGVATGPPAQNFVGNFRYENMNFGLCRILIAVINGNVNKNVVLPDNIWDAITITAYSTYVLVNVFAPSGVTGAWLTHPAKSTLAYTFPASGNGWDSGNMATMSGAGGWHLSVDDLLKVMGTFRRKGTIISPDKAFHMLESGLGLDVISDTAAGKLYSKNGLWGDWRSNIEQSLAYFLPEDIEMVVLANSPVGNPGKFFMGVVSDTYLANLN